MISSIQDLTNLADELHTLRDRLATLPDLYAALLRVKEALEAGDTREAMHTINNALQDVNAVAELDARGIA
jgi:C4-dicarboxylate-specific signal transduction histidine kinase